MMESQPQCTINLTQELLMRAVSIMMVATAILAACGDSDDHGDEPVAPVLNTEQRCRDFLGKTFEDAVVTEARFVETTEGIPEHCIVRGEMSKDLDFEVRMPTEWNMRTVFIGGGGFDGLITSAERAGGSPVLVPQGYATIATNHGHNAESTPGASFALDEDMLLDYAYRSVPRVMVPAKAILSSRYGDRFQQTKIVFE